ncbi:isoprenylcysteine carboxylmethyltransferase family protein [Methanoculleus sp. FWC-SCC1]|uniref:Isoprenylcysteine carboxylmethyltransferase family protein n=1 Tax=Methanoculleus frigidifontis TaxID=2584085 RepID=A0ABT8M710_9EURY|nr:isoprenylcysteine carboxylmethyltransferase family protein [Methanoculleus sp. FWC-SCC1]MDN7023706.1 isoprenylcysteine carboxylmethyltransferase family protein [Methanoculleus sp. FWC-SCC1]
MGGGTTFRVQRAILVRFATGIVVIALLLFVPAGSIAYWEGWLYMAVLFVPTVFVVLHFLKHDPKFLERRMKMREWESEQQAIVILSAVIFFVGFLIPGLDHRFGWSDVPVAAVLVADGVVLSGYAIAFLAMRENTYAGAVVEVEAGQEVIDTSPYAVVRHPMYPGAVLVFLAPPLAIGWFWALVTCLPLPALLVRRIRGEEETLVRDLRRIGGKHATGLSPICGERSV